VPLIAERIKDLADMTLPAKRRAELLAALDSDDFEAREKATKELACGDATVAEELRKVLKEGKPSLEARRRIESAAEQIEEQEGAVSGPVLQWQRAVEVLERAGTPEARRLLEKVAAVEGPVADDAKAALERLQRIDGGKAP
jgi:hypothetical protein